MLHTWVMLFGNTYVYRWHLFNLVNLVVWINLGRRERGLVYYIYVESSYLPKPPIYLQTSKISQISQILWYPRYSYLMLPKHWHINLSISHKYSNLRILQTPSVRNKTIFFFLNMLNMVDIYTGGWWRAVVPKPGTCRPQPASWRAPLDALTQTYLLSLKLS